MANSASDHWNCAQKVEEDLLILIHGPKPTYEEIEILIHKMRIACEQTIFLDFEFAAKVSVGKRLWNAHTLINNRYRKILGRYKGDKKLVVEKRKVEKHYVDFIKTSQFFYKGYIQRLASRFSGIKGLLRIAGKLCQDPLPIDSSISISPDLQKIVEQSCQATLLRLGDLSRYRNMLRIRKRSWEPAMGYYQLANNIDPLSGMAHNKMAVIALADENHLNAVYYLYRAIASPKPDPLAPGNLELEFKKIMTARLTPQNDFPESLIWWFVYLHANLNEGVELSNYEELQNEFFSRFTICLKDESCEYLLEKFVLISIAAQYYSSQRLQEQGSEKILRATRKLNYHVAFNIKMMYHLLSAILPELQDKTASQELPQCSTENPSLMHDKISVITGRVLPALRHYTLWLASSKERVQFNVGISEIKTQSKQLWNTYASVLTRLVNYFPVKEMATVPYLLEEDEKTLGFMPFRDLLLVKALNFYSKSDGQLKPYIGENGIKRSHPIVEIQSRILDIVCCGIQLQMDDNIPIQLHNYTGSPVFTTVEDDLSFTRSPTSTPDDLPNDQKTVSVTCDEYVADEFIDQSLSVVSDDSDIDSDSQDSVELSMNRMVDNLLEPLPNGSKSECTETYTGLYSRNASLTFTPSIKNSSDPRHQSTPKIFPSLPGLYNSAFTPQPNELQPISPILPMTSRQYSPFSLTSKDERYSSVSALDEMNGYVYMSDSFHHNSSTPSISGSKTLGDSHSQDTSFPMYSGSSNNVNIYTSPNTPEYIKKLKVQHKQDDSIYHSVSDVDHYPELRSTRSHKLQFSSVQEG